MHLDFFVPDDWVHLVGFAGANDWLVWVASASIVIASSIALTQDHLKRRLAYSTVSQLAYVTLAAAIMAPLSLVGAAMHIAAHAVGKITLFFAAGSIHTAAHKDYVSQLDGIGRPGWPTSAAQKSPVLGSKLIRQTLRSPIA